MVNTNGFRQFENLSQICCTYCLYRLVALGFRVISLLFHYCAADYIGTVSYTHLTLPTIYSV